MVKSALPTRTIFKKPGKREMVSLALLAIGLILVTAQFLTNLGSYFKSFFVHPNEPVSYRFESYDRLLQSVVKSNLVSYQELVSSKDLNEAINELVRTSPARLADPKQQMCFWINAYNLLVLKDVADNYPVRSINDIQKTISLKKFVVGGQPYSLQDIEVRQLRPLFLDYDARGCLLLCPGHAGDPQLLNHAIQPERLNDEMNYAAFLFVNDPENASFDPDTLFFILSRYFKLFELPLGRQYHSAFAFANRYLIPVHRVNMRDAHLHYAYSDRFDTLLNDVSLAEAIRQYRVGSPDITLPLIPLSRP